MSRIGRKLGGIGGRVRSAAPAIGRSLRRRVRLPLRTGGRGLLRPVPLGLAAIVLLSGASGIVLLTRDGAEPERLPAPSATDQGGGSARTRSSFLSRLIPPPPERARGPRVPSSIGDLARRLPLERKVAQLFVWGFEGQDLTDPLYQRLRELDLGGIVIRQRNYVDPQQLSALAGEGVVISQQEGHVPPWVFASQEGAEFNAFAALPPSGAPADYDTPQEAAAAAGQAAASLRPLGITAALGPVVDTGPEDGGAVGARAYSDDPAAVAQFGELAVGAYTQAGMLAAPKHFPGLGAASQDTEEGPASVGLSLEELAQRDLIPFRAVIEAGAPALLVGHGLYGVGDSVTPASLSPEITTGLLRERLGFKGVAIADDLSSPAVTAASSAPDAAVEALRAGADLLIVSGPAGEQEAAYVAVLNAVRRGDVSRRRIDEAVLRILTAKAEQGLIGEGGEGAAAGAPAPGAPAPGAAAPGAPAAPGTAAPGPPGAG